MLASNPSPDALGKAFLGVSSGTEVKWNNESVRSAAASDSIFDLGPTMWQSMGGVVKVLNPVNIIGHLTGSNDRSQHETDHRRRDQQAECIDR